MPDKQQQSLDHVLEALKRHMDEDRQRSSGWHLKREVQIGHVITTITVLFSVVWYAGKLEQRIALTEEKIQQVVASQKERETNLAQRFDRLESKIDRLIETRTRP
jgi:hypothetical protein